MTRVEGAAAVRRHLGGAMEALGWILREGLRCFAARTIVATLAGLGGLALAAAAVGGVVLYARAVETGEAVRVAGRAIAIEGRASTFVVFVIAIGSLGLVSAGGLYLSERMLNRLTRDFQRMTMARVLRVVSDPAYRGWPAALPGASRRTLGRLLKIGSRRSAYAWRDVVGCIVPAATFVVAFVCLLVTDALVTIVLVPIVVGYVVPMYLINRRAARCQRSYYEAMGVARRGLAQTLRDVLETSLPPAQKQARVEDALAAADLRAAEGFFYDRLLASRRTQLLNAVFFVCCLITLFVFFGVATRASDRVWSDLLLYLVALRFVMSSLQQVSGRLTRTARFYSEYSRVVGFLKGAEAIRARRGEAGPLPDELTVRAVRDAAWQSERRLVVQRGQVVWVLVPAPPTHLELECVALRLERRLRGDVDLVGRLAVDAGVSAETEADACAAPPSDADDAVMLAARPFLARDAAVIAGRLDALAGRYVILVDDRVGGVLPTLDGPIATRIAGVVVMDGDDVRGLGPASWLVAHRDEIAEHLRSARAAAREAEDDEDDEDEEE